jgi:steroid 5-alpha reductase family enzyme
MPISIPALGIVFNVFNGYLQGGWLFRVSPPYSASWLRDPRFLSGAALFLAGMAINWHSDSVLRNLRKSGPLPDGRGSATAARSNRAVTVRERSAATEYKVPQGGLYRWVSCPNYLGEIVEWLGWAIATWSPAGAVFAFWTAANLIPRALSHHKWYRQHFPDYPKSRRPVIPSLYTL